MKKVVIDIERMKYRNIGLYTFCKELSKRLKKVENNFVLFGMEENGGVIKPNFLSKFFGVWTDRTVGLWHATHQDVKYLPLKKIPILLTIHDLNFLYTNKSISKKEKRLKKIQRLIDRAKHVVVISNYVKEDVLKHLKVDEKKISVIYNGTEIPNFKERKVDGDYLFTIGTVVEKKNFHVLPSLLVGNNLKLKIAGVLSDKNYLEKLLKEATVLKVEDRVEILGAISDEEKYNLYKNCKAFVFPSLSEGFGLPVIEAMNFGKPTFLSNKTSLPEIGGTEAFYFESFDSLHMQTVFAKGMREYETMSDKSEKIKEWSQKFSWATCVNSYNELYEKLK